ncbi:MAG: FAD-dependent oxidoreductase [Burkholderiales bacterium]
MKKLLLIGGGHSHVEVLRRLADEPLADAEVTLISPHRHTGYSGMLPGWIAGHYTREDCHIDLEALAQAARCRFARTSANGMQPDVRLAFGSDGTVFSYDIASIDVGSRPGLLDVPGAAEYALPVKPLERFIARWESIVSGEVTMPQDARIVTVGGGAAGVEVLLAMQHRLRTARADPPRLRFALATDSDDILPMHSPAVRRVFRSVLRDREVEVFTGFGAARVMPDGIECATGNRIHSALTVWATGASAPFWPQASGLACDARGFIRVSPALQSVNRSGIFAAGDIATMDGMPRPKSGVFAVRQGPPLAENLRRALQGRDLLDHRPQREALALISTGDRYAVASRGRWMLRGAWVWHWKNRIDQRFMAKYAC